ncbi:hypothetical protein AB0B50_44035 [Streptomyces sp. NPDC041068]|uniref:hypothetical protein n=1 Tax=Streptomyces sp. NPDC041068 TaxID=3155130 RepID=UPI0033DF76AE
MTDDQKPQAPARDQHEHPERAPYPENWGGGKGIEGQFDVDTGVPDARDVHYRLDPFEDDAPDANSSAAVGAPRAAAPAAPAASNTASFTTTPAADGNHVVQARSVDRADNVGPIDAIKGGYRSTRCTTTSRVMSVRS